jgi:hypothetical protein
LAFLQEARKILEEICGPQDAPIQVTISNEAGDSVRLVLLGEGQMPHRYEPAPEESFNLPLIHLRDIHRKLRAATPEKPTTAIRICRWAGYPRCNSYHRRALSDLVRWGILRHGPDGYWKTKE